MTNDADWVEDVRRWVANSASPKASDAVEQTDHMALGYEAAHPALQARHWPEAVTSSFGEFR